MKVYELRLKVFLLMPIKREEALIRTATCIDRTLLQSEEWGKVHCENRYKGYCYCAPFPLAENGFYSAQRVYQIKIRTIVPELAVYLAEMLPKYEDKYMKGLICEVQELWERRISSLYSITPVIVKGEGNKYWRDTINFQEFEEQIKKNLLKKYQAFYKEKLDEDFPLYTLIEFKNRVPVKIPYKGVHLLGDKLQLQISEYPQAKKLAFMALGTGLGTMNMRGMGYVNAKF